MKSPIRRVLILGHTGFIGTHLTRQVAADHAGLEVVGRAPVALDLTHEQSRGSLYELFDPGTAVLMLAAVKRQFGDNVDAFSRNIAMVMNLCRLLQERPIGRLIYFSSAAVYGEETHDLHITEETCVNPMSYYGTAKFAGECLFRQLIRARPDVSLLCIRPPLVYGAGDRGETYGPSGFIRSVIRGKPITLWGDGTELREFVYVEDIARIVSQLVSSDHQGVLNVASGSSYSFRTALDVLERLSPGPLEVSSRPRTKKSVDNGFDNERLRTLLPAHHFTPLEEGMRKAFLAERQALQA